MNGQGATLQHTTHLVLIPSYNGGPALARTALAARAAWQPVWIVVDGSTDGSDQGVMAERVIRLPRNVGKGAAVLVGITAALEAGFTHALVMDGDDQHDVASIAPMMQASLAEPGAMILGQPVFGPDAPWPRVLGRRLSNLLTHIETGWAGIADGLFGLRVYPLVPLCAVMAETRWMRRFDFDAEAAVRLVWRGLKVRNLPTPVRYPSADAGGVSHFRYGRDNLVLAWMHARLCAGTARRSLVFNKLMSGLAVRSRGD